MAKTTSQIQAEKKKLQESFAPTEKKLNDAHAKQMAKIGYTPEKERANLTAAREANKRREQNVAAQAAKKTNHEANKTAVDKMWDRNSQSRQRTEQDDALSALLGAKKNTERKQKDLEDYLNTEIDWTASDERKRFDQGQKLKEQEIAKAQAAQNAAVANFDRAQMNAMSEEDRALIDEYIRREDTASDPFDTGTAEIVEHFVNKNAGIDENRLKQLVETRRRELNAQRMQETQEKAQAEVNDGWMSATWANLKTVPANLVAGAMGTMSAIHGLANQDERYSGLDPNSMGNQLNVYSGAVRGQTQQNIVGTEEERAAQIASLVEKGYGLSEAEFIVNKGRQGLGALYQGGMSAADTAARAAAGGALGLGAGFGATVAGLNTFSQTMSDASARGATPEQALALAVTTAGIEAATEKVPLDNLIKVSKGGGAKSFIKNILRQAGIEATEEELSLIGTTLADAAIMQEKSEYSLSVAAYMASGMTEEQAREQANLDLIAEAGETAIVSGIAGGIGGFGASSAAAFNRDGLDTTQQGAQQDQTAQNQQDVNVDSQTEDDGLTDAQRFARDAQRAIEETGAQEAKKVPKAEPEVKTPEQTALEDGIQKTLNQNREKEAGKQREKEVYESLKAAQREQKNLQKEIERAENKLRETGKGSPFRIDQLKQQLEQQDNLVKQLESQRMYFNGDYERNVSDAIRNQQRIFDSAKERAAQAISDYEAGKITEAQKNAEVDAYNRAGAELKRLSGMTQEQYRADLAEAGLVADMPEQESVAGNAETNGEADANGVQHEIVTQERTAEYDSAPTVDSPKASAQGGQGETVSKNADPAPDNGREVQKAEQGQRGEQGVQSEQPVQPDGSTVGMQNTPSGEVKKSKTFTNTGLHNADEDIRRGYRETLRQDPTAGDYEVKRNADTHATAQERTNSPERVQAEYEYLTAKEGPWTAEDVDTAAIAQKELFKAGEAEKFSALAAAKKKALSNMGQAIQAASIGGTMKEASDPMTACDSAIDGIMKMKDSESTFKAKDGKTYEQWQKDMSTEFTRIAIAIESVEDGDAGAMRDIIRQIARDRKTTAWFGASERMTHNANRILSKLGFDDLKKIANTQLAAMPDDFKRRSKTEITMGLRKQSMLTSFKTIARNIAGNSAAGFMDSFSDSAGGQFADILLSKITGKRTVGSDLTRGKEYVNAAKDAMDFASLCVELNIPIETDVDASYAAASGDGKKGGKYVAKTFRSQGNFAMRALYAYQKYMSYALEVSDKVFEGGTNAAVAESLARINNSGLTDTDIQELAEYTGNRRTFKDATFDSYNKKGEQVTRGSDLSRAAQSIKKIGDGTVVEPVAKTVTDIALPFASAPMNVAQTGIDYTVGMAKSVGEIKSIIRDAKAGREISVARQRQAATDFGRGMTGMAMICLFTTAAAKGIIAVHNDKDKNKKALEQSEGLSGAQINWSALERSMNGESEEWQDGDVLSSLDFLEPYNTQLYLACELAKEDTMQDALKAYPKATFWAVRDAFMDSPMVQGITDIADLISGVQDAENAEDIWNEVAGYAGDVASSFVPQIVRQAAQAKDGYYRDTRGADAEEYAKNNFLNAIPGASETLPKKVNGFGQEQERLGWMSTFFDPTNTQKYQKNEISGYLEDLSGKTGDTSIYPERQAPMKVKNADGTDVELDGGQREQYQKVYGQYVDGYYSAMIKDSDFKNLPDDLKTAAMNKAKEYAKGHARASVSDFKEVKVGNYDEVKSEIIRDVVIENMAKSIGSMEVAWEYGYNPTPRLQQMKEAYDAYDGLSNAQKEEFRKDVEGDAARYTEVRENGVSTTDYLTALKAAKNVKGTGTYNEETGENNIRDIDVRGAIAGTGLPDTVVDKLMHAYMPDYDPDAEVKQKTELKYDYTREELGLTPSEYVGAYKVQLDGGKKNEKINAWMDMGYERETANLLYRLFAATGRTKIDVEEWWESKRE